MKGVQQVSGEMSPEISPTWQVEGSTPEWDFLKGVRRCGTGARLAGVAGFISKFRLRNPITSGVLAVIDLLDVNLATGGIFVTVSLIETETNLAGLAFSTVMDRRWRPSGVATQTALIFSAQATDNVAPEGGAVFVRTRSNPNVSMQYTQGIVLPPGIGIEWGGTTFQMDISCYLAWRERAVPALEL